VRGLCLYGRDTHFLVALSWHEQAEEGSLESRSEGPPRPEKEP
jgi:hypothetical protein